MDESRLKGIALFAQLSKRERSKLARHLVEVEVPLGEHVVKEGEISHEFFVIEEGTAAVISSGKHLTDLGPGDFLGEIGLVQRSDRTASVIATSPIKAIVMAEEDFLAMSRSIPEVARQIDAAMQERLERDRQFGLDPARSR
jgi:CRP/FNR family transcriptional regulator, cyclic AMP receptor protein